VKLGDRVDQSVYPDILEQTCKTGQDG